MTDPKKPATPEHNTVLPSDIDAQGNVTLWDSGPPDDDPTAEAWHEQYGDGPVPVVMHSSDAAHALAVDPDRWSIEPEDMDAEIEAEVKKAQEARAAAKKAAEEREAAIELAADRKNAVATVMANRAAKAAAEKPEKSKKAPAKAKAENTTYPAPKHT